MEIACRSAFGGRVTQARFTDQVAGGEILCLVITLDT